MHEVKFYLFYGDDAAHLSTFSIISLHKCAETLITALMISLEIHHPIQNIYTIFVGTFNFS